MSKTIQNPALPLPNASPDDKTKSVLTITSELEKIKVDFNLLNGRNAHGTRSYPRNTGIQTDNVVSVSLNEQFDKIDKVNGLKTTLYPHQQTVVKAMLELENRRTFSVTNTSDAVIKTSYNVGVLSEPVGSGKTIDILALCCLSKIPRAIPDIMELKQGSLYNFTGYVRCKFKKFLKPTLIFVGSSVMKQWENAIKTFTNFKYFSVNSVIELKVLFDMIQSKLVNDYDIILVKNGKITVPITLPDGNILEDKNKVGQPYIYNLIANLREYCWARVVVDDFDTIRLPHNAGIVRGIFTWYISSTRKKMDYRTSNRNHFNLASEVLLHHDYGCANIMYNHFLFKNLNIRNNIEYLRSTTKIPNPKFHIAVFKNPNDKYISLLNSMGDSEINRVTEMLNGDAICAAAETVGIKATSVANIFEKVLTDKFEKYRFAGDLLEFINYQESKEDDRRPMEQNPDPEDKYYGKKRLLAFEDIEYKYPGVKTLLTDTTTEYTEVKKQTGIAIDRVKDNLKTGECPVCKTDLADCREMFIVKCCNKVYCGPCGIKAQNLNDRYTRLENGRCANCRAQLSIKDLIYIGSEIKLDNILNEQFEDEDKQVDPIKIEKKIAQTKYTAIIEIINGVPIDEDKRVDMHIPNMMKGSDYLPEAKIRKVLIFANFEETLKEVIKELKKTSIKFWYLCGGINELNETSMAFTNCKETCAMVINSTQHCSGLNLQTATDLIFTHRMIDPAVESQVAGRGHRLGRKSPLNIWYMAYDNEYQELCNTHSVRVLTKEELEHEIKMEKGIEHAAVNDVTDNSEECYLNKSKKKSKTGGSFFKDNTADKNESDDHKDESDDNKEESNEDESDDI